jgi:hypothetical protein
MLSSQIKLIFHQVLLSLTIFTHSLTEPNPYWEAAHCGAAQELPSVLWNPKVHYRVHKSPPLVPILSQIDPIPTIPSYLSKIHFNIVHPPTSWSSLWSLSFYISHLYAFLFSPIRATFPANLILLDSLTTFSKHNWNFRILFCLYRQYLKHGRGAVLLWFCRGRRLLGLSAIPCKMRDRVTPS